MEEDTKFAIRKTELANSYINYSVMYQLPHDDTWWVLSTSTYETKEEAMTHIRSIKDMKVVKTELVYSE